MVASQGSLFLSEEEMFPFFPFSVGMLSFSFYFSCGRAGARACQAGAAEFGVENGG